MQAFFCFLICLIATTVGGISGVGGGVVIKPVLDAVSGMGVAAISFLSGVTVLAMTLTSLIRSRGGPVNIERRRGTLLAVGAVVGGLLGKQIFELVLEAGGSLVSISQQVMMIVLTLGVLIYTLRKDKIHTLNVEYSWACLLIGLVLGLLSAFLGIGGGPINLALLYFFFSMDSKTAALNSLYIIFFSQAASLISAFIGGSVPQVSVVVMLVMMLGGILGGNLSRSLSARMSNKGVDKLFLCLLIFIIATSVYNLLKLI